MICNGEDTEMFLQMSATIRYDTIEEFNVQLSFIGPSDNKSILHRNLRQSIIHQTSNYIFTSSAEFLAVIPCCLSALANSSVYK